VRMAMANDDGWRRTSASNVRTWRALYPCSRLALAMHAKLFARRALGRARVTRKPALENRRSKRAGGSVRFARSRCRHGLDDAPSHTLDVRSRRTPQRYGSNPATLSPPTGRRNTVRSDPSLVHAVKSRCNVVTRG